MRRVKTTKIQSKVYLCDSIKDAEKVFRQFIKQEKVGAEHSYRWSGQMGSIDIEDIRIYCMTEEQFEKWKKTHIDFTVVHAVLQKAR